MDSFVYFGLPLSINFGKDKKELQQLNGDPLEMLMKKIKKLKCQDLQIMMPKLKEVG